MRYHSKLFVWLALFVVSVLLAACGGGEADDDAGTEPAAEGEPDSFPSGTIELTIPHPAGGGTDTVNRLMAPLLSEELDTRIDVVVRDGGAGAVAVAHLLEQPPDGHTLLAIEGGIATTGPAGNPDLPYDPPESFTPVALMTNDPWVLLASQDSGLTSIEDFNEALESPEGLRIGIAGVMSSDHYGLLLLTRDVDGQNLNWVAYGGGGPKEQAAYAGEVDVILDTAEVAASELVVPLAVLGEERLEQFPDVPTAIESGYDGAVAALWQGISVHHEAPDSIIDRLSEAIVSVASSDEFEEEMTTLGLRTHPMGREEFQEFIEAEYTQAAELAQTIAEEQIEETSG